MDPTCTKLQQHYLHCITKGFTSFRLRQVLHPATSVKSGYSKI